MIKHASCSSWSRAVLGASVIVALLSNSRSAFADIQYPSKGDLHEFQSVCAGGNVTLAKGQLDGALETWRLRPGAHVNLDVVIKDLGGVIEKVKVDSNGSKIYETYANCVQNLILNYLKMANTPSSSRPEPRAGKPSS
jgi:hypothetical protein